MYACIKQGCFIGELTGTGVGIRLGSEGTRLFGRSQPFGVSSEVCFPDNRRIEFFDIIKGPPIPIWEPGFEQRQRFVYFIYKFA